METTHLWKKFDLNTAWFFKIFCNYVPICCYFGTPFNQVQNYLNPSFLRATCSKGKSKIMQNNGENGEGFRQKENLGHHNFLNTAY